MLKKLFIATTLLFNVHIVLSTQHEECYCQNRNVRIEYQNIDLSHVLNMVDFNRIAIEYNNHMNGIKKMGHQVEQCEWANYDFSDKIGPTKETLSLLRNLLYTLQLQTEPCHVCGRSPFVNDNALYMTLGKHIKEIVEQLETSLTQSIVTPGIAVIESDPAQIKQAIEYLLQHLPDFLSKKMGCEVSFAFTNIEREVNLYHPNNDILIKQLVKFKQWEQQAIQNQQLKENRAFAQALVKDPNHREGFWKTNEWQESKIKKIYYRWINQGTLDNPILNRVIYKTDEQDALNRYPEDARVFAQKLVKNPNYREGVWEINGFTEPRDQWEGPKHMYYKWINKGTLDNPILIQVIYKIENILI